MRLLYQILAGITVLSVLASCEKKCTQLNVCRVYLNSNKTPRIIGYLAPDVDTQMILFYKPNGRFDELVDSGCYINTEVTGGYIYNETDTQYLAISFTGSTATSQRIDDVKLVLPGVRSYFFTDVMVNGDYFEEDDFTCSDGSRGCSRRVISMKIDGVYHDFSDGNTQLELFK